MQNFVIPVSIILVLLTPIFADCIVAANVNYDAQKPYIIDEILKVIPNKESITYTSVPRGIILSVAQSELFEGSSTCISQNGQRLLQKIADMLESFDNKCTIETHSEEELSEEGIYQEDWEISIVRANAIANYLIYKLRVSSDRIFPIGFGKIMPFKGNVSKADFPDNRIDFVIFDYTVSR